MSGKKIVKQHRKGQFVRNDPRTYRGGRKRTGIVQLKDMLTSILLEKPDLEFGTKTWYEAICREMVLQAAKGNRRARETIFNRLFGKEDATVNMRMIQGEDPFIVALGRIHESLMLYGPDDDSDDE